MLDKTILVQKIVDEHHELERLGDYDSASELRTAIEKAGKVAGLGGFYYHVDLDKDGNIDVEISHDVIEYHSWNLDELNMPALQLLLTKARNLVAALHEGLKKNKCS